MVRTMSTLRVPILLGLAFVSALAAAASPVGTWKGKLQISLPKLPANASPQQKEMMTKAAAMLSKASFTLVVKADKSFVFTSAAMPGGKAQTESGKWSQAGAVVTFVSAKKTAEPAQKLTLSANGKTMTQDLPGGRGKVIFTK